ncbi:MAG: ABC transporter permease [Acidimicrobiia bacterium]|nr:ABC transporter permease [Acidimicrobiia bacterium]MCY4457856.1 ABC transporter permease [Acidimicrobiaceae bacterium]
MSLIRKIHSCSTPVRWMIYAALGILLLALVQSLTGAAELTTAKTSGAMLRWTVPVMLAGLGGMFAERVGVVNIGLDGIMLLGMWFGAWGTINYGPWVGLLIGLLGGALGGLAHAIATVSFGVDHIISGVAVLIAAPGITRFLSLEIFSGHEGGSITQSPRLEGAGRFSLPFLAGGDIGAWQSPDVLGWLASKDWWYVSDLSGFAHGLVFNLSLFTILAFLLVPFSAWVLWRTRFGLRLRICGEHPTAGESQGINVYLYKYIGVILSGVLAGFAGAFIATPELNGIYLEGSVNQRGFIGLAALIIGNWRPAGIMAGAMLFGYPFALGLRDLDGSNTHALLLVAVLVLAVVSVNNFRRAKLVDGALGGLIAVLALVWFGVSDTVPNWFINILPQLIVLLVLTFFSQRLRMPAADGQPYRRGKS